VPAVVRQRPQTAAPEDLFADPAIYI